MSVPTWLRLPTLAALLLVAALAVTAAAQAPKKQEPSPEPPDNTKLKVLDEPEDKGGKRPDVIFVPTPQPVVEKALELAGVKKADVLFSLGCGDGRWMVTAAKKYGCRAVGFDIDPQRVRESKDNIEQNKVGKLAFVRQRDVFRLDLSQATVVTLYLLPSLNVKLIPQLQKLPKGARIVSHDFDMQGVRPDQVIRVRGPVREHTIYLYTTPLKLVKP